MKNKISKKGFTLIELLSVIVILAIIFAIAVPNIITAVSNSRKKSFYSSVSNIVNSIKTQNFINDNDYCIYEYDYDKDNKTELIDILNIIAHKENGKIVYSVLAKYNKESFIINTYDFKKLKVSDNTWISDKTYEESLANLIDEEVAGTSEYKTCELSK